MEDSLFEITSLSSDTYNNTLTEGGTLSSNLLTYKPLGSSVLAGLGATTTSGSDDGIIIVGIEHVYEDSLGNIHTSDKNNYKKIEERAQNIYDKYNKSHKVSKKPSIIIANTPEQAIALDELLSSGSKEELYVRLTALQMVLEEIEEEKSIEVNPKIKSLKKED